MLKPPPGGFFNCISFYLGARNLIHMNFFRKELSNDELIYIYRNLLLPRMIEEKMLVLLRQGRISKWFSGIGQEAIAVGSTLALQKNEWIMPLHRNLGVFTSRQMSLQKLFMQWQGNKDGYSKGRGAQLLQKDQLACQ